MQRRGLSALRPGSGLHERVRAELQIRGEGTRHRDGERQLRRTLLPFGAGTVAVAGLVGNSRARAVCELDESRDERSNPRLRNFRSCFQGDEIALIGGDSINGARKRSLRCVAYDGAVATFGFATIKGAVGGGQ